MGFGVDNALELISRIGGGLVPSHDSSPQSHYNWRLRMWAVTCMNFCAWMIGAIIAFGYIPSVSAGFAMKEDVVALARSTLSTQLLQLRKDQCRATTPDQKLLYYRLMTESMAEYKKLTGAHWQVPPCEALL